VAICNNHGAHVIENDWPGFGAQQRRAQALASGDWVLSLDADERVTQALAQEIQSILPHTAANGFSIPFVSTHLGRTILHGDWQGEHHLRLFRHSAGQFSSDRIHERLIIEGQTQTLHNHIEHHPFENLEEVLDKVNRYSTEGAALKLAQGRRSSISKALFHALWTFFKGYILKRGFLDGREGFLLAISNAEGCFYRYVKLLYLQQSG